MTIECHPIYGPCYLDRSTINRKPLKATGKVIWIKRLTESGRDWSHVNLESLGIL